MKDIYKKVMAVVIMSAVIILVFRAGVVTGSQNGTGYGTPGSVNDPLITKSYLEERLAALGIGQGNGGLGSQGGDGYQGGMIKLTLSKGDIVLGDEGTTFVLVEGSASTYSDSVINITQGEVMKDGMTVSKYNTFLTTAKDAGVLAESRAVVYVAGSYETVSARN